MPAIFQLVSGGGLPKPEAESVKFCGDIEHLSMLVAGVLLLTYVAGLFFSLKTHRDLFNPEHYAEDEEGEPWSVRKAVTMARDRRRRGRRDVGDPRRLDHRGVGRDRAVARSSSP